MPRVLSHVVLLAGVALYVTLLPTLATGAVIDFEEAGAIADKVNDVPTAKHNGALLNATLAQLQSGDTLIIPQKTFHIMGGIKASGLRDVTLQIDGTLDFSDSIGDWPRNGDGKDAKVLECIEFRSFENVTITSSTVGVLNGNGKRWWGIPGIGYLVRKENRPRLFSIRDSKGILVENILFKDSPYWTFYAPGSDGLEIRHCEIDARRRPAASNHNIWEMTAGLSIGVLVVDRSLGKTAPMT